MFNLFYWTTYLFRDDIAELWTQKNNETFAWITHLSINPTYFVLAWKYNAENPNDQLLTLTKNNQQVVLKTNERIPDYPSSLLCTLTPTFRIHL